MLGVGRDGTIWLRSDDGLARFGGRTLDRFLPGWCILMDLAAHGSVWVLASDDMLWAYDEGEWMLDHDQTWDLCVISPAAVTASEQARGHVRREPW